VRLEAPLVLTPHPLWGAASSGRTRCAPNPLPRRTQVELAAGELPLAFEGEERSAAGVGDVMQVRLPMVCQLEQGQTGCAAWHVAAMLCLLSDRSHHPLCERLLAGSAPYPALRCQ